jgi:hypothetical protein
MGLGIRANKSLILLASLAVLGACGDDDVTNVVPPVATTLTITTGTDSQTAVAGAALATPISVHVLDQSGVAIANATVTWEVLTGGGSMGSATSTTNATGDATAAWTLGMTAGENTVKASLANGQSVTFTATGTAAVAFSGSGT